MDFAFKCPSILEWHIDLLWFVLQGLDMFGDWADMSLEWVDDIFDLIENRNLSVDLCGQLINVLAHSQVVLETLSLQLW